MHMITFEHVSKQFNSGIEALKDVSFSVDPGEFMFLVGPSGAGKTTLLRFLIRDDIPTTGDVLFKEESVVKLPGRKIPWLRRRIGMVFQDFRLLPRSTVYENVAVTLEVIGKHKAEIKEIVPFMLEKVGLEQKAYAFPHELSTGESQRVAIARALVHEPDVLLADEPTGNLDTHNSWEIMDLISQINEWGTTVIMATHDDRIVDKLKKRVVKIENGKIVKDRVGKY